MPLTATPQCTEIQHTCQARWADKAVVTNNISDMPEKDQIVNLMKTTTTADATTPWSNLNDSAATDTGSTQWE